MTKIDQGLKGSKAILSIFVHFYTGKKMNLRINWELLSSSCN